MKLWILIALLTQTLVSEATGLAWRSSLSFSIENETSQGEFIDSRWTFHLGYFQSGFVPTEINTQDWCQQWITLDVSPYSDFQNRFASVWQDDGSVAAGTKGYIWGFNRNAASKEWILISDSDWSWPLVSSNPLDPNGGAEWTVDGAGEVIVGAVNQNGVHLRTAAVTGSPPLLEGQQWRELVFTAAELEDETVSGWEADDDGDGWSNLAEFAFALDPRAADTPVVTESLEEGFFEFTIQKNEKVAIVYTGQVSGDLLGWSADVADVLLIGETATSLTYRDLGPFSEAPRFGRVQVALSP